MRSGSDLLAMHLHCKSSTKYRNIQRHVTGPGDNSLSDWTRKQEVKESDAELKTKVLLNYNPFKRNPRMFINPAGMHAVDAESRPAPGC